MAKGLWILITKDSIGYLNSRFFRTRSPLYGIFYCLCLTFACLMFECSFKTKLSDHGLKGKNKRRACARFSDFQSEGRTKVVFCV